jgi:acylphosphatase
MGEMRRANIRIKGNVQMAGFRTFIKNIADSLNVKGYAGNQEDGSVKVVCEGEEEGIKELINAIKESPPSFARIDEVSVEYGDYKGEFTDFERRGTDVPREDKEDAMLRYMQSFDKKGEVMIDILSSMNGTLKSVKEDTGQMLEKQDTMLEKQDMMLEKQDMMLEKQDMMLEKQDMMLEKQDTMLEKQDMMLEKQDDTIAEIRNVSVKIDLGKDEIVKEISSLRGDLKSYMENKFAKIEHEIAGIKAKIGMV